MYVLAVYGIPLVIWALLALLYRHIGKRRHIGPVWSLIFAFISPIFAPFIILASKRNYQPIYQKKAWLKVIAILIGAYGLLILIGGFNTNIYSQGGSFNRYQGEPNPVNKTNETQIYMDTGGNLGRVLFLGPSSLMLEYHTSLLLDYRYARFNKIWIGLLLISLAVYLMTPRTISTEIAENDESVKITDKINKALLKAQTILFNYYSRFKLEFKHLIYAVISISIGFIAGWYYKQPDPELIADLLRSSAEWRKDLLLQKYAAEGFFFNPHFHFNWLVFLVISIVSFVFISFLYNRTFRKKLYQRIGMLKEEVRG